MNVAFSCVAENREDWFDRTLTLALSIRRLGGSLAGAPVVVNFVDGAEPWFVDRLAELDVEVGVVERVDPDYPYANKLRMLQAAQERGFDLLVALDCDVVVVGDLGPFAVDDAVSAKPADCDFLSPGQWVRLFDDLELPAPAREFRTTTFGQRTVPYFNSGVVLVPAGTCAPLYDLWLDHEYRLQGSFDRHPDIARHRMYTDQIALTCALVAGGFPIRSLPVTVNFPGHLNVHPALWRQDVPPRAIHYHNRVDDRGFLLPTRYPSVNERIDALNRERADVLGLAYRPPPAFGPMERIAQELRSRRWMHHPAPLAAKRAAGRMVRRVGGSR